MKTKIIEASNNQMNWGKFLVGQMTDEWDRRSAVSGLTMPLLREIGWTPDSILVLDLQTCEGACFPPAGSASADLNKHRIWVCPLFEPFLAWLYKQDLTDVDKLPDFVNLPEAEYALWGYRRPGPKASNPAA